jgi:hypothetical protein
MGRRPLASAWWKPIRSIGRAWQTGPADERIGLVVNAGLRLSIAYFLAEVLLHPDDPRFAGKAIPIRNLIIVGSQYATDVLFGTHNVRGVSDTVNDLLAGLLGTGTYMAIDVLRTRRG